ncbi:MAG: acetyl-CoA/propionyl-CoA carboxylase, biotin carboxylase, biotin carboxyl carrier protein [Solirubrobacterales bacterium]|jgi:acetyl-CoA/propionyl-CoA carboxylase biotin carboxyl carrier protein|nr:acetyl-CoA/propionyl-CoA carboxylase, biotin carboxylase, biotin carboxyl carrier protein [Solirubrobacterales bacterium]
MFEKVLVANRGEIAVRVIRTLKEMGIASVAVYSEADRESIAVRIADEAYLLGPPTPAESYLNIPKIIEVAKEAGAEAVHPGYGFLAENATFAMALDDADLTFIGPPAAAIEAMGSKTKAREIMQKAGVPIVPGSTEPSPDAKAAKKVAKEIGYPVACKAAGGGGGKGFRVAMSEDELEEAFEGAAREGEKFFSDDRVYLERYLEDPRHVEVQVLADSHGNVIHLGERDCSIQRRHQKLIEEAPGPLVDDEMRERIGKIATDAAAAVDYRGAGTIEGMQVGDEYFFLEMNTRVQVEHCVTEMVTGIDIVREQVRVAAGEELSIKQEDVRLTGHAIECRINAEAAHKNFAPAPGPIESYIEPSGPGVRVDSGLEAGSEVTPLYDPMVAKLITWDVDRPSATRRMLRALDEYKIEPLTTLIPFHKAVMASEEWAEASTFREKIADKKWLKTLAPEAPAKPAEGEEEAKSERTYQVEVNGRLHSVKVIGAAAPAGGAANGAGAKRPAKRERKAGGGSAASGNDIVSPLQGTMFKVNVEKGQDVEEGAIICVIEAMKMENEITAHKSGKITALSVAEGQPISSGDPIATIE